MIAAENFWNGGHGLQQQMDDVQTPSDAVSHENGYLQPSVGQYCV